MLTVPKIKFCGITRGQDAEVALEAGAWALGMIFWRPSRRSCRLVRAAEIAAVAGRRAELVGVFVNATLTEIDRAVEAAPLSLIQLHGDEGPSFCAEVARRSGARVIKAGRIRTRADIQALASFHTDFHLLDSYQKGLPGGTGEAFAWELARGHRGKVPVILSGGLRPTNVAAAIRAVSPFAVDVASGVEASPGIKDPDAVRAFAAAVHQVAETPSAA